MPFDPQLIAALHLHVTRRPELRAEHARHVAFQTSTIDALLDGAYDGDLTIDELREHGDHGIGTFQGLDGELVLVDSEVWRADVDARLHRVAGGERTPFAVVTPFAADVTVEIERPLDQEALLALVDERLPPGPACDAVRLDGAFERLRVRSVPRQQPPYRPLAEVVADQREHELRDVRATLVGYRFPGYARGVEVPGHHLHAVTADRARGGHVLDCRVRSATLQIDRLSELHMELPPGVELEPGDGDPDRDATLRHIEGG